MGTCREILARALGRSSPPRPEPAPTAPVRTFLEIKDLQDKGFEVVASVVNEGEDWLWIRGATVDVGKDGRSFGRHVVSFPGGGQPIRLGQFESAEGHFHLAADLSVKAIACSVRVDYTYGDRPESQTVTQRVDTQRITRKA